MSFYDDAKKNIGLVVVTLVMCFPSMLLVCNYFGYELLRKSDYVSIKEHESSLKAMLQNDSVVSLSEYKASQENLKSWMESHKKYELALNQCNSNFSILSELSKINNRKKELETLNERLSSAYEFGNPNNDILPNNKIRIESNRQSIKDLSVLAVETTKKISCIP